MNDKQQEGMNLSKNTGNFNFKDLHSPIKESKNEVQGVPVVAQQVRNYTGIHEDQGLISRLTQWVKDLALLQAVVQVAG